MWAVRESPGGPPHGAGAGARPAGGAASMRGRVHTGSAGRYLWRHQNDRAVRQPLPQKAGPDQQRGRALAEDDGVRDDHPPHRGIPREPVYKIVFIAPNEACLTEVKRQYEDQFVFCESRLGDEGGGIVNGELINRKFNKGSGIRAICNHLGCSLADTIGFGDSDNDLQMTDVVGISVCMANGSDNLKKRCDRICPAVTDDGIAREFAALGLI